MFVLTFNTICSMSKKNPPHRPTKYKPEYDDMVVDWLADGKTLQSFGEHIGASNATLYNWQKNQSFLDAIKKGRKIAHEIYSEQFLYDKLENQKINNVITILYCRNVLNIKTKDDSNIEDLTKALQNLTIQRKVIDDASGNS